MRVPASACPKCGAVLDAATEVSRRGPPREGDFTVCIECLSLLTFEAGLTLRRLTEEEFAGLPAETVENLDRIRQAIVEPRYIAQLEKMAANARTWRAAHPERVAQVQFNFPPYVAVVQPISNAVKMGTVSTNEAGLELLKAMWPWDCASEPTVLMVRAALEG